MTPDEIAEIALFARSAEPSASSSARAAADITLDGGRVRRARGRRARAVRRARGAHRVGQARRRDRARSSASGSPATIFGEVPIALGTVFPVGFRAAEPSRVMRVEPPRLPRDRGGRAGRRREVGKLAAHRISGPRGLQGIAAEPTAAARDRRRPPLGPRLRGAAPVPRPQPGHVRLAHAGLRRRRRSAGAAALPARTTGPRSGSSAARPSCVRSSAAWPSCSDLGTEAEAPEYDTVVVGAGPAGLAAAVYGASEGLRTIVVEREAPGGQAGTSSRIENYLGFPSGVSGDELASRALQAGAAARRRDPRHADRSRGSTPRRARCTSTAATCSARGRSSSRAAWPGGSSRSRGSTGWPGKGIFYGAARSEAPNTHGLDIHIIGAGNSAGQAAMFFSTHARSVTILCRGAGLDKSMSRYLIDQIATRPNISLLSRSQVAAVHGDASLEAIDVHNSETGATTRLESGGLFIFIGADARREWLPPEIALDERGFVLTGPEMRANAQLGARARPVPPRDQRPRHLRLRRRAPRARQACGVRGRRGQHGDRLRPPVPARHGAGTDADGLKMMGAWARLDGWTPWQTWSATG